jgi:lysophospholipase L1-like esterase
MLLDCVALGDSIAVGVGHARPDCKVMAVTGITSGRYVELLPPLRATQTAIISLGVNDSDDMDTLANLRRLRSEVRAKTVYWMLVGTNPRSRDAVRLVAAEYRDRMIDVAPLAGPDHIHPDRTGYARLAAATRIPSVSIATQKVAMHHLQAPPGMRPVHP